MHIIYVYIYQLIGEVKWTKTWLTIKNGCKGLRWNNPWTTRSCKFDLGLLNNVFVTYMISRPFLKGMHISLDSWSPYWDPEGSKQDPDGLIIDLSEDNFGGDAEEFLGKVTGMSIRGAAAEKGRPKMVRAAQVFFSDIQINERLTRDKGPPLQTVHLNQIGLAQYRL